MALKIVDPAVISKTERLAEIAGLSNADAVEKAVDAFLAQHSPTEASDAWECMDAMLRQLDRIPGLPHPVDPLISGCPNDGCLGTEG